MTTETLTFPGKGDQSISIGEVDLRGDYTVSCWVWSSGICGDMWTIFGNPERFLFGLWNGVPAIRIAGKEVRAGVQLPEKEWTHLAWSYTAQTGIMLIFQNGKLRGEIKDVQEIKETNPVQLGPTHDRDHFCGNLYELRVWDHARTEAQTSSQLNWNLESTTPGLRLYRRLSRDSDGELSLEDSRWKFRYGLPKPYLQVDAPPSPPPELAQLRAELESIRAQAAQDAAREAESKKAIQAKLDSSQANLSAAQADLTQAKQEVQRYRDGAVPLDTWLESVATHVDNARSAIASKSGVRLGTVRLDLMVLPAGDGSSVRFPATDDIAKMQSESLSMVSVALEPPNDPPRLPVRLVQVPDLYGSSRSLALELLDAASLEMEIIPMVVDGASRARDIGRVVEQRPAAGKKVSPHTRITLYLGLAG